MPMPVTKDTHQPREKLRMASDSQIDHRPGEGEAAHDEAKPRDTEDPGASGDCLVTVQSQGTGLIPTFLLILPKASAGAR